MTKTSRNLRTALITSTFPKRTKAACKYYCYEKTCRKYSSTSLQALFQVPVQNVHIMQLESQYRSVHPFFRKRFMMEMVSAAPMKYHSTVYQGTVPKKKPQERLRPKRETFSKQCIVAVLNLAKRRQQATQTYHMRPPSLNHIPTSLLL